MPSEQDKADVAAAMDRINHAWQQRRPEDLTDLLHPDITLTFPGFSGKAVGREAIVAGFADFCFNATILDYGEGARQIDVVGDAAVVSYPYEMTYERDGGRYRAAGRDLWVFCRQNGAWLAAWRTMTDVTERPDPAERRSHAG